MSDAKITLLRHLRLLALRAKQHALGLTSSLADSTATAIEQLDQEVSEVTTYVPSVSEDGTMSWTNDKGKENPAPVNIAQLVIQNLPDGDTATYGDGDTEVYGS